MTRNTSLLPADVSTPEPAPAELSETDLPVPAPRSDVAASPDPVVAVKPAQPKPGQTAAPPALWLVIGAVVLALALAAYFLR